MVKNIPSKEKPWLKYYSKDAVDMPLPDCSAYEYIFENNKERKDNIALKYFGRKISYCQMFELIDRTADALSDLGVTNGEIVTMCVTNTPEAVYCFYAINKIGAISNLIDLRSSKEELQNLFCEVPSRIVITLDVCLTNILSIIDKTSIEKIIVLSAYSSCPWPVCLKKADMPKHPKVLSWKDFIKGKTGAVSISKSIRDSNETAVIVHTGGTTGVPKGVEISNRSLNCVAFEYKYSGMEMKQGQKILTMVPIFILNGLCTCLNMPLAVGLTCILIPEFIQEKFPLYLKERPEHIVAAPTWWEKLSYDERMKKFDLSFIYTAATGGDGINIANEERLNSFFYAHHSNSCLIIGYGMTELGSSVCTGMNHCHKLGSVGIPLPRVTIAAFDEQNNDVGYDVQGEICVSGPSLMNKYCGFAASETDNILKKHKDGKIWAHTGDIGYIDKEGFVFISGRIKRIIICEGGYKIFPVLIENVISAIEGVKSCVVVGFTPDKSFTGQLPAAFLVSNNDKVTDQCIKLCKEKLPDFYVPRKFIYIDKLPLTPVGKVDYKELERSLINEKN